MTSASTTALRWRARHVKDAMQPELGTADDSRIHLSFTGQHNQSSDSHDIPVDDKKTSQIWFLRPASACSWFNVAVRSIATASIISTVAALEHWRTWNMACLCTTSVALSLLLWYQLERLHTLRNIRYQVNKTRQAQNRLAVQREALTRQVLRAEQDATALSHVAVQMGTLTSNSRKTVAELMGLAKEWANVNEQLQRLLHAKVQQEVLQVVLDSDADGNFVLNPREWKRLQIRLAQIPGVELVTPTRHETGILEADDEDDEDKPSSPQGVSVIEILRVLQQAQQTRPRRSSQRSDASLSDASSSVVETTTRLTNDISVRLDPRQLSVAG